MERNILIGENSYFLTSDYDYLDDMGAVFELHMVELFKTVIGTDDIGWCQPRLRCSGTKG